MAGAIASHVLFLGYEIMGDGGLLFSLAAIVLILNLLIILFNFQKLLTININKPFTLINQLSL
jgi:hypothetical protein